MKNNIKIFEDERKGMLEQKINLWLNQKREEFREEWENNDDDYKVIKTIEIISISYSTHAVGMNNEYFSSSALMVYKIIR